MKKLSTLIGVVGLGVTCAFGAGGTGYTGAPAASVLTVTLAPNVPLVVLTNNVTVQGVSFLTPAGTGLVSLYDASTTNAPIYGTNYVTSSFISRASYMTNYVTSFVGYNGYTNWYTNNGVWTYNVTNAAATNALSPQSVYPVISGVISTYNSPVSIQQGLSLVATTNVTAFISYTPNR